VSEKPIDLSKQRANKKKRDYAALVMRVFDDFEHEDRRAFLERRAEVERKARQVIGYETLTSGPRKTKP